MTKIEKQEQNKNSKNKKLRLKYKIANKINTTFRHEGWVGTKKN